MYPEGKQTIHDNPSATTPQGLQRELSTNLKIKSQHWQHMLFKYHRNKLFHELLIEIKITSKYFLKDIFVQDILIIKQLSQADKEGLSQDQSCQSFGQIVS